MIYSFPTVHGGREVHDIRLTFEAGRVVDATASKSQGFLIKMLDQDKLARVLGEIAIGTNHAIREYTRNTLFDEKIGGTFHAAVGAAYPETGGRNESGLHWDMVCDLHKSGTIEVDGKTISRNGRFLRTRLAPAAARKGLPGPPEGVTDPFPAPVVADRKGRSRFADNRRDLPRDFSSKARSIASSNMNQDGTPEFLPSWKVTHI